MTSLFLLIRIVQRLNSLFLPACSESCWLFRENDSWCCGEAGVEGSLDTHTDGHFHCSVVLCFLSAVHIFHFCLQSLHLDTCWWRPLSLELICLTWFSPLFTKKYFYPPTNASPCFIDHILLTRFDIFEVKSTNAILGSLSVSQAKVGLVWWNRSSSWAALYPRVHSSLSLLKVAVQSSPYFRTA